MVEREAVHRSSFIAHRLISSLWLGSAFFLMLAASAAFRAAPDATTAADVVGAMLARWHYIALAAPLLLFALELRKPRHFVLMVTFAALLIAAAQVVIDLRIRTIRMMSAVPISSLDRDHPVRRRFGALHGASMLLLLAQTIAAAAVVAARPKRDEEDVMTDIDREDTTIYRVVENADGQYSIWPAEGEIPLGWNDVGVTGTKAECLAYIEQVWRPIHLGDADTSGGGP